MSIDHVKQIADAIGGKIESAGALPDGSGFATVSYPLPKDHWLTAEGHNVPPMPFRMGTDDPRRREWADKIRLAAKHAIRASTMNGADNDFDPDAMVQNMVVGMLGYWTPDALSYWEGKEEKWSNPQPHPPLFP